MAPPAEPRFFLAPSVNSALLQCNIAAASRRWHVGSPEPPGLPLLLRKMWTREHSFAELDTTGTDVQLARRRAAHLGDIPSDRRRRGWRADSGRAMRPRRDDFDGWYPEHSLSSEGRGSIEGRGSRATRGPGDLGARWPGIQATVQLIGESCRRSPCGEPQPHCDGNGRPPLCTCHDPDLSPSTPEARRRLERRAVGARIALLLVVAKT